MTDAQIDILRTLQAFPGQTAVELGEKTKGGTLRNLFKDGLIDAVERKGVNRYSLTPKGNRTLATLDAGSGEMAAPRQHVSTQPYTGERWVTRPGSEPHAGYRRPMLIASAVLPSKGLAL